MSRLAFRDWCQKHLRSIRLQNVVEEQSEHDSWEYLSQRAKISKESSEFIMQLRQLRFGSIQSGSFVQSRYSVIKPKSGADEATKAKKTAKISPLKKLSSVNRFRGDAKLVTLYQLGQNNNRFEEEKKEEMSEASLSSLGSLDSSQKSQQSHEFQEDDE